MISIYPGVYVGTVDEAFRWKGRAILAAKEPCHRYAVGYSSKAAPKDSPEYLIARRGNRMILNAVDNIAVQWIDKGMIQQALDFVSPEEATLIACNQGRSRSPAIALMWMLKCGHIKAASLVDAENDFKHLYPAYAPTQGYRDFINQNYF